MSEDISPEQLFERQFEVEELYRCLELLDEDERSLINTIVFDSLTEQEYAERIGLSQKALISAEGILLMKKVLSVYH